MINFKTLLKTITPTKSELETFVLSLALMAGLLFSILFFGYVFFLLLFKSFTIFGMPVTMLVLCFLIFLIMSLPDLIARYKRIERESKD